MQAMGAKKQDLEEARWDDVRLFLAAYRHRSLGAAAARIGLDVSTLSRRLGALEAALGVRLFDRTRQGMAPTRAGEQLLPAAEAMEAAHGRLRRDASSVEREVEGVVRLSVAPGMADTFIAPALPALRALHPKLCLELDASVSAVDLTRRQADLALRSVQPHGAELVLTKLLTAPWVVMGRHELVKRLGRISSWLAAPWITWDRDLASLPPARWLARHAPHADLALRTSHFASQLSAARAGLGLVLVPEPYARVYELVPVRVGAALQAAAEEYPVDALWLVGHRALRDVPRVAAVWTFLSKLLRPRTRRTSSC